MISPPKRSSFFDPSPHLPLTDYGRQLTYLLTVTLLLHLGLSLGKAFLTGLFSCLADLSACGLLIWGLRSRSPCPLLAYLIFCLLGAVSHLASLGYLLQTGTPRTTLSWVFLTIQLAFYLGAVWGSFLG